MQNKTKQQNTTTKQQNKAQYKTKLNQNNTTQNK